MTGNTIIGLGKGALFALLTLIYWPVQANEVKLLKITESIEKIRKNHAVAAATVLLVSQDEVLLNFQTGVRNWETKQSFSKHDMYRIGSISKTFAGLLAMRLEAEGKIKLTDEIRNYGLSAYFENNHPNHNITLAHLLEHTAGLGDLTKAEWDYNQSEPISLRQAFDLKLGQHQTLWVPEHRSYSNVGAGLFGLALENKLATSYEKLMQQYVFEPLGMSHSTLLLTPAVKQHLITGYDRDGETPIPYWHNIYRPFAAINSNNDDIIKWLQMLLSPHNDFLNQVSRQRIITPTTTVSAQSGLTFGYGLGIYQWQTNGHSFWGHGGDADGYLTRFAYNPESGLAYFVMINAFNHQPLRQMVDVLEQQITQHLPKPKYPLRLKLDAPQLQSYAGTYQPITKRFGTLQKQSKRALEIFWEKGQLSLSYTAGRKVKLYAVSDNLFRTVDQSVATMAFIKKDGNLYFQNDQGESWLKQ